jgi:hypothetical protein
VNYPEYAMDIAYDVNNCKVNPADFGALFSVEKERQMWVQSPTKMLLLLLLLLPSCRRISQRQLS